MRQYMRTLNWEYHPEYVYGIKDLKNFLTLNIKTLTMLTMFVLEKFTKEIVNFLTLNTMKENLLLKRILSLQ